MTGSGSTNSDAEDLQLLAAWRAGDQSAGSRLFRKYAPALSRFFRNKLPHDDDAVDLLQETMVGLLGGEFGQSRQMVCVRNYLYAVAQNKLCRYLRKRYKLDQERTDFAVVCVTSLAPGSPSSIVARRRQIQDFVEALREIPLDDQILLEYRYFEDLTAREIADVLAIPESTLNGRLQRAKARLHDKSAAGSRSRRDSGLLAEPAENDLELWAREIREQSTSVPRVVR